jgi:hypothetical protein
LLEGVESGADKFLAEMGHTLEKLRCFGRGSFRNKSGTHSNRKLALDIYLDGGYLKEDVRTLE